MTVKQEIVAAIVEDLKHIPDHYLESVQHIVHSIRVNVPQTQSIEVENNEYWDNLLVGVYKNQERVDTILTDQSATREKELLKLIYDGLSEKEEVRLDELDEKRQQNILNSKEYDELLELVKRVETFNANRLRYLSELAQLRKIDLRTLMKELNLKPRVRA